MTPATQPNTKGLGHRQQHVLDTIDNIAQKHPGIWLIATTIPDTNGHQLPHTHVQTATLARRQLISTAYAIIHGKRRRLVRSRHVHTHKTTKIIDLNTRIIRHNPTIHNITHPK